MSLFLKMWNANEKRKMFWMRGTFSVSSAPVEPEGEESSY